MSKIPPPTPPLVAGVPENAAWTITVKPRQDILKSTSAETDPTTPPPRQNALTEIRSTKSGRVKRDIAVYQGRPEKTFYLYDDYIVTLRSNNRDYAVVDAKTVMAVGPDAPAIYRELGNLVFSPGFPGFDWLQLKYYAGVVLWNKKIPCYHYIITGAHGSGAGEARAEAWVDARTLLPVCYTWNGLDYVYSFRDDPGTVVSLPEAALEALR